MMVAVAVVAAILGAVTMWMQTAEHELEFDDTVLAAKHLEPGGHGPSKVSVIRLIANPDLYHGKPVRIDGFLHVRREGTGLYLSRDDANHLIKSNGLAISFGNDRSAWDSQGLSPERFNRKFVMIEGVFDKGLVGHMGMWPAGVREVWRVMELTKYSND
jgi:hypothetical protein